MRKMGYFLIFLFLLFNPAFASDAQFGRYNYSNYAAMNQQLQYQRANAIRRQRMYNQSPARNIVIPRGNAGYYPNIERKNYSRNNYRYQRYGY